MKIAIIYADSRLYIQSVAVSRWLSRKNYMFGGNAICGVLRWQKPAKAKLETSFSKQVTFDTLFLNNSGKIFVQKQLTNIRVAFRKACSNKHWDRTLKTYDSAKQLRPLVFHVMYEIENFLLKKNDFVSYFASNICTFFGKRFVPEELPLAGFSKFEHYRNPRVGVL